VCGVGVWGYHEQGQLPELLPGHWYDVPGVLAAVEDYVAVLVLDVLGCWGPIAFVILHPVNPAEAQRECREQRWKFGG
jgi:hypothetical protein